MIIKIGLCLTIIFIGLALVILLSSCCLFTVNRYGVGFRNIGEHKIDVFFTSKIGNYTPPVGILPPSKNGLAGSGSHYGLPETVKIKWRKENGEIIERDVKVKENMPEDFSNGDTIIFNINKDDEVVLSFEVRKSKFNEVDSNGNKVDFRNTIKADTSSHVNPVTKPPVATGNGALISSSPPTVPVDLERIEGVKIINHVGEQWNGSIYTESRNAFSCQPPRFPGNQIQILCQDMAGAPTNTTVFHDENFWLIAIICTKIRPDYPMDDSLLEKKTYPSLALLEKMGRDKYKRIWESQNGHKLIKEINTGPCYQKLDELKWGFDTNGFTSEKTDWCRIDRHLVKDGFYLTVVTFVQSGADKEAICDRYSKFIVDQILK
jgi:hypothetical protein